MLDFAEIPMLYTHNSFDTLTADAAGALTFPLAGK
jgi:hypothetical protein